jgi:hypothetical protein
MIRAWAGDCYPARDEVILQTIPELVLPSAWQA